MTIEKIYKSLTKNQLGVYRGTEVDKTDGKIMHILEVTTPEGVVEHTHVADSTFKRWWKLVEETTAEDLEESMASLNEIKDTVLKEQPTIEDLKQLNESGEELTEEELQLFKQQAQEQQAEQKQNEEQPVKKAKKAKRTKTEQPESGVRTFFEQKVYELGGRVALYVEAGKRVVKNKNDKTVLFYWATRNDTIKLCMKEKLDPVIDCPVDVEEKHTFPKQYPYRMSVTTLNDETQQLLTNILELHI